jgi:ubiquinone/menaquinone biosynthesis C-methylase UbiE
LLAIANLNSEKMSAQTSNHAPRRQGFCRLTRDDAAPMTRAKPPLAASLSVQVADFMCMLKGLEPGLQTRVERQEILVPALSCFTLGGNAMASTNKLFAGPIPEIYDHLLVPLIFEAYAAGLAERITALHPRRVLEIAAGTGALTRAIASRLDAEASIVATDLNQPMLDRATARQRTDHRIVWQQADALSLPFADQSFDAVACQFGVMFFPDRIRGYREVLRVVKPGGSFWFNSWDRISHNDFPHIVSQTLETLFPDDPPRFMATTPHGYHDVEKIRSDLTEAGFHAISIETLDQRSRAGSAGDVARAFCQGTPLRHEIEARAPSGLEAATRACAAALLRHFGSGAIEGKIQAHVVYAARR